MHSLLRAMVHHGIPSDAAKVIVVVALFAIASVLSRLIGRAVTHLRTRVESISLDSPLVAIAQRETAVALLQAAVRYVVFFVALVLAITTVSGATRFSALAGASFTAVIIGFAAQRFLIDIISGFLMFFEGWYTVGSTVVVEPWKLEGVVEDVSLRATKIRAVSGDVIRLNNSSIMALRVLPDGGHRYEVELFVHDADAAERLVETVAQIVPSGPTAFVVPPEVVSVKELDHDLYRVTAKAAVAVGCAWMADDLLPSLLRERADDDLIVHGPVILPTDASAASRFERAGRLRQRRRASSSPR